MEIVSGDYSKSYLVSGAAASCSPGYGKSFDNESAKCRHIIIIDHWRDLGSPLHPPPPPATEIDSRVSMVGNEEGRSCRTSLRFTWRVSWRFTFDFHSCHWNYVINSRPGETTSVNWVPWLKISTRRQIKPGGIIAEDLKWTANASSLGLINLTRCVPNVKEMTKWAIKEFSRDSQIRKER